MIPISIFGRCPFYGKSAPSRDVSVKSGVHTTVGGLHTGPAGITEVARGQTGLGEARENLGVWFESLETYSNRGLYRGHLGEAAHGRSTYLIIENCEVPKY